MVYYLSWAIVVDEECLDVAVEGFQKNTGIPDGISRIFWKREAFMQWQISAIRRKNRSIQVLIKVCGYPGYWTLTPVY